MKNLEKWLLKPKETTQKTDINRKYQIKFLPLLKKHYDIHRKKLQRS